MKYIVSYWDNIKEEYKENSFNKRENAQLFKDRLEQKGCSQNIQLRIK